MRTFPLLALLALGCRAPAEDPLAADADEDGVTVGDGDCNDADAAVYPGATESCNGVDDDCVGGIDDGASDATTWYGDADGDGYGDATDASIACDAPSGTVADGTDCDDLEAAVHPGAPETDCADPTDYNCDGSSGFADADADGHPACEDCDDTEAAAHPGAVELCDGLDNDCDGDPDGGAVDATTWYVDADGDGHGSPTATVEACEQPTGAVAATAADDCDDATASTFPGADELCDEVDSDCDGEARDGDATDAQTWYADLDGDGHGGDRVTAKACDAPEGHTAEKTDCDDLVAATNPGATETCNGVDDDCDGTVDDEPSDPRTFYADADGDGFGSEAKPVTACAAPPGHVEDATDCDDAAATTHPGAAEACDDVDQDCDGATRDPDAADAPTWYQDLDKDGFGDDEFTRVACDQPTGFVDEGGDCGPIDKTIHPGATEACDDVDRDCDGAVLSPAEALGDATCPASSCLDILETRTEAPPDGIFWVDPADPYEIFCDMTHDGGGWTLVANIDDVNDKYWGGAKVAAWETADERNPDQIPTFDDDITVSTKYASYGTLVPKDLRIAYKNDDKYFLCQGLTDNRTKAPVSAPLSDLFKLTPNNGECRSVCTTWKEDRMPEATVAPVGLNCSDPNEGWSHTTPITAENARIGGLNQPNSCCVVNGFAGAIGDRGFSTGNLEKTWAAYSSGKVTDDNVMIFVR